MSIQIAADSSPVAAFIPPAGIVAATSAETASSTTALTSAVGMPAIAAASLASIAAAGAISPFRVQENTPLKFQVLSRKLLELGYCEIENSSSLRYILRNILRQLVDVTTDTQTKKKLKTFSKNIILATEMQTVTDRTLAESIERFISDRETADRFDCSNIHYNQQLQIKNSLLTGAKLLAQLSSYWDTPLEVALNLYLPEEDPLKIVAHFLKEREMFTGYLTNLGERVAQQLSLFVENTPLNKHDHSLVLQLIVDVLIDDPSIDEHQSQLPPHLQQPIHTLLEPYYTAKKVKNVANILGPSIPTDFYADLISAGPVGRSLTEPQGHIPTLLHAFLHKFKQFNDKLDAFEDRVTFNKRHLALKRAVTAVEGDEGLKKLKGRALKEQLAKKGEKEGAKVDKLSSNINNIFHHLSILKNIHRRLEDHVTRCTSISPSFIRTSHLLIDQAKKEATEIHNVITIEVNRNLLSQQALSDEVITPQATLKDCSEALSLLATPQMNHGASAPDRFHSMEKKLQYRRNILEGRADLDIEGLLFTLHKNIGILNGFQTEAESLVHITKAVGYLLGCDMEKTEKDLARDSAAYEARFASLAEELDPPGAKLPDLFSAAARTFIPTPPHRSSSATDRTITTPSPPPLARSVTFSPSPTLRGHTPSDRLFAGSPPPIACAKASTYEAPPVAVEPPPESSLGLSASTSSIACLVKHMMIIRPPMVAKGSILTEESTSHLILAGQDIEQLIKAIQNRDLPLFRAAASLLMIDTHVAIEQHLKAQLVGSAADLTDHSLVSLEAMLGREIDPVFRPLLQESDLSIIWARYPEKALQTHSYKRRKSPLIQCIELLSSLRGLESDRDLRSADTILFQLKGILTQSSRLILGQETASSIEVLLAAPLASDRPRPPRKQNELDKVIDAVEETLTEICARSDLDPTSLTSLREVTHYLDWIKAAQNTLQSDSHKSSSYWIMRLFIGGVDKLFENLYIGAAAAHGHREIRSHNLLSLRRELFNKSIKSNLCEEEVAHIAGFNIGNALQYPHQQKSARSTILLKALNYSFSHIGVEEGFSPVRADIMSDWQQTLGTQVENALSIWLKEARALFPAEGGSGSSASAAGSGSR